MNPIKKNIIYLVLALLLGSFLTVGINTLEQDLEHYFFAEEFKSRPMTAQLAAAESKKIKQSEPEKFEVKLNAGSALSVWTDLESSEVLFKKNASKSFPIASLSKLMTGYVVREIPETYAVDKAITVSDKSVEQDGNFNLRPGERLTVKNLLAMTLIESSNDAAYALADIIGEKPFVDLMNYYAEEINLNQTEFYNPTGLKVEDQPENHSSAQDLVKLSKEILKKHPELFELSSQESYQITRPDGFPHHYIEKNTNILLEEFPNMVGGKTGYTDGAQQCLLTVVKDEQGEGYYINVILGSNDRFGEMKKLIEHVQ